MRGDEPAADSSAPKKAKVNTALLRSLSLLCVCVLSLWAHMFMYICTLMVAAE